MCKPISRCNFCESIHHLILIAVIIFLLIILVAVIFHFILELKKINKDKNNANARKKKSLAYSLHKPLERNIIMTVNDLNGNKEKEYKVTIKS